MQKKIKCTATARVQTPRQANMHLQANVPLSQACSSVNLSFKGGKACVTSHCRGTFKEEAISEEAHTIKPTAASQRPC